MIRMIELWHQPSFEIPTKSSSLEALNTRGMKNLRFQPRIITYYILLISVLIFSADALRTVVVVPFFFSCIFSSFWRHTIKSIQVPYNAMQWYLNSKWQTQIGKIETMRYKKYQNKNN